MRQRTVTILLLLITWASWGQYRPNGKVYVNGKELEIASDGPPYFEFNPFDTTLTKSAIDYLNDFGKFYKDSLLRKKTYLIELTPGLTKEEREKDKDLGEKRLMTIINYLETNFQINRREFKFRYSVAITKDGCVGFLVKKKNTKRARKERKKLKFEEDKYFKDE